MGKFQFTKRKTVVGCVLMQFALFHDFFFFFFFPFFLPCNLREKILTLSNFDYTAGMTSNCCWFSFSLAYCRRESVRFVLSSASFVLCLTSPTCLNKKK